MEQNLFEEFQNKKNKLKSLALKAKDFGWIDENRCKELIDKLEKDILTIGVIGQMKCGGCKSIIIKRISIIIFTRGRCQK